MSDDKPPTEPTEPPIPLPAPPTPEEQRKQQAIQAVQNLWEVTFRQSLPGQVHMQCEQLRQFLTAYIEEH
jgi:hypothetical protein